jgi:hypothetical protein
LTIQTCPSDEVHASPETVWRLLVNASALASWSGTRLVQGPGRDLRSGDRVTFRASLGLEVFFEVREAISPREFHVDVQLPFGVVNHEVVVISPMAGGCRVTLN